jgi:hypothetical protein
MKKIILKRIEGFTPKDYIKRTAREEDYKTFINESCMLIDEDTAQIIAIYFVMPETPSALLTSLLSIKYGTNKRLQGLITHSRIFGWRPREKVRNDFCSSASLAATNPKEHGIIIDFAKQLTKYYKEFSPEIFKEHDDIAHDNVLKEWLIEDTPFSSGIINQNNALHYHYDSGNFKEVYSNMVAFKSNIKGGYLSIPEYDIGLEIATNSVLLFDGQKLLHGVTPIKLLNENSYRYTVVYYTLKQMWQCEPVTDEVARYKEKRTTLERKRLLRLQGKIPNEI